MSNRSEIHSVYVALHAHQAAFGHMKMVNIVTCLFGREKWAWPVIGITPAALALYREAEWKRPKVKMVRAHLIPRSDMVRHILNRPEPMTEDELFDYWLKADRTVIVGPGENKKNVPEYLPIDNPDCRLFTCSDGVGFDYHPAVEGAFLAALDRRLK
jgi:hypothetical protein